IVASPDQAMTTHLHRMRLGETDDLITLAKIKSAVVVPHDPPFHRVFRLYHVELARESGNVRGFRELGRTHRGAYQQAGTSRRLPQGRGGNAGCCSSSQERG